MCGRFGLAADSAWAAKFWGARPDYGFEPNYNVSPGQIVPAIMIDQRKGAKSEKAILGFKWGFIPHWAKDQSIGLKMINARAETIAEKPSFRSAFRKARCLILATGFYEWKKQSSASTGGRGRSLPYYYRLKSREMFGFAGLWTTWKNPESGEDVKSCTIITTEPNAVVREVHDRMPVVIEKGREMGWINPSNQDMTALKSMLAPYPSANMESFRVSTEVNASKENDAHLIEPMAGTEESEDKAKKSQSLSKFF